MSSAEIVAKVNQRGMEGPPELRTAARPAGVKTLFGGPAAGFAWGVNGYAATN